MTTIVSIIMPTYNSADYMVQSIESILEQTYQNWELLICDDHSTDDSVEIAKDFTKKDKRIKTLPSKKNFGPAVTRNRGIDAACGRFIAFLDSDDIWANIKLEKQIGFMIDNGIVLSYSHYKTINETGDVIHQATKLPSSMDYEHLLRNPVIGCLTAIYDTEKCGKLKMPVIRKRQDFALWLRILKKGHVAKCFPESLAFYRIRSGSVSRNKWIAIQYTWKVYREIERLPLLKSSYYFVIYLFHKLFKI